MLPIKIARTCLGNCFLQAFKKPNKKYLLLCADNAAHNSSSVIWISVCLFSNDSTINIYISQEWMLGNNKEQ